MLTNPPFGAKITQEKHLIEVSCHSKGNNVSFCTQFIWKDVCNMRKFTSFVFALALCASLAVPAAAVWSPQGGNNGGATTSPKTGSSAVAVLALSTCAAGGIGAVAYKKSKE